MHPKLVTVYGFCLHCTWLYMPVQACSSILVYFGHIHAVLQIQRGYTRIYAPGAKNTCCSQPYRQSCLQLLFISKLAVSNLPSLSLQSRAPSQGAGAEIADIAWNRKVQHILASCTVGGTVTVWDLKKQQPVLNIRDSSG